MDKNEWLAIGYEKGIIDELPETEQVFFETVYNSWFMTKVNRIRPQSVDRLEAVWRKYYRGSGFVRTPVHLVDEEQVYKFMNNIILHSGKITRKEYLRIYQIVNNVMLYASDLNIGHARAINWGIVKRYIAIDHFTVNGHQEFCVPETDRKKFFHAVLIDKLHPMKRSAGLCLCLNFFLGLRVSELAALRWEDVHLPERYVYVHSTQTRAYKRDESGARLENEYFIQDTTKTLHSVRSIPLIRESVYILTELKKWHDRMGYTSPYLAYDGVDVVLSHSIDRTLHRICILCGIPCFNTHKIRKTFASELHRNGVPTKMISELMGHTDIRTTEQNYIIHYADTMQYVRQAMQAGMKIGI